jgi:hypothetical protein
MSKLFKMKNYTTSVSADRSILEIEQMLQKFGATAVMKEFLMDGRVNSMTFKIGEMAFKLPANVEGVHKVMFKEKRSSSRRDAMKNREEQSYRTAWRVLKDWIYAQLSIIASGQALPEEIMLPFMFDGKRTLYQAYKEGRLQLEQK